MKRLLVYMLAGMTLAGTSCSDFLDTVPNDALSPSTTWQTEDDAAKFLIGCYDGWIDDTGIFYWDCASDFGFNFHIHEGWRNIGNGSMTSSNSVANYYSFSKIRICIDFLKNIEGVSFANQKDKDNMIGQVRTIRAYQYFNMNWLYGGVPIIDAYETAEEARVPRASEQEVKEYIYQDLDAAIPLLNDAPAASGYIAKGTALALKVRVAMFYGDYQIAKNAASQLMALGLYDLDDDYANLFTIAGQSSKEIIMAVQHDENLYSDWMVATMYNNADGGWSSMVPTQNLIDAYEMSNGLTKDEAGSGYDATHPFANRDPRMAMTVLYPGMDWEGINGKTILNTLDATLSNGSSNPNKPDGADNASKTCLTWAKYLTPMSQYNDVWSNKSQAILFRYAEVLLSYAEAENELNGPTDEVYTILNRIRTRVGMPDVNRSKYNSKETVRELIRRERSVELAGEGIRRMDIIRWKDASGKMLAETVLNQPLTRIKGTVNENEADPTKRATVTGTDLVENRTFAAYNRYLPIPLSALDKNKSLTQNEGY